MPQVTNILIDYDNNLIANTELSKLANKYNISNGYAQTTFADFTDSLSGNIFDIAKHPIQKEYVFCSNSSHEIVRMVSEKVCQKILTKEPINSPRELIFDGNNDLLILSETGIYRSIVE
ncbi:MAG: hypothetical protein IPO21_08875 [Bacteroidales bacterium]|nr:hypothetical protein [Bacteroidales bacterium]